MKRIIGSLIAILIATVSLSGQGSVCNQSVAVNLSAAIGNTIMVAAPPTGSIYVCGFNISAGDGLRSITGTNPAAGVEVTETVPANARWNLSSFKASLVTSATVANRIVTFIIDDGTNALFGAATTTQIASQTLVYYFGNSGAKDVATTQAVVLTSIPNITLGPSFRIRTSTSLIDAGDDYSAPQYLIQEWGVFQLTSGTGAGCGTGTTNLTGIYTLQPGDSVSAFGTSPVIAVPSGNGLCIVNYRLNTLVGTISYTVK